MPIVIIVIEQPITGHKEMSKENYKKFATLGIEPNAKKEFKSVKLPNETDTQALRRLINFYKKHSHTNALNDMEAAIS